MAGDQKWVGEGADPSLDMWAAATLSGVLGPRKCMHHISTPVHTDAGALRLEFGPHSPLPTPGPWGSTPPEPPPRAALTGRPKVWLLS